MLHPFALPLRLALVLCVALLAASCGGGGSGGTTTTTTTTTTVAGVDPASPPASPPAPVVPVVPTLSISAAGSVAGKVWPAMEVRVDGALIGTIDVSSSEFTVYTLTLPAALTTGSKVDVVFTNDAVVDGEDRNLYVAYVQSGGTTMTPNAPGVTFDRGYGAQALDGIDILAADTGMFFSGALRFTWTAPRNFNAAAFAKQYAASRFLQQASFGPTPSEIDHVASIGVSAWIDEQLAKPYAADFVNDVEAQFARGDDYRPGGGKYDAGVPNQKFWMTAVTSSDQLRKRTAFALNHIMMVAEYDGNLSNHSRAYAAYLDTLNRNALGNFRTLMEDIALSPATGMYLSHMRNRKEDPTVGRLPDENFARELMQLFTIGLNELNLDGSLKLGPDGQPIETYNNNDVMAMAKVFTGWSWGFPDAQLTDANFAWGDPPLGTAAGDQRVDLQRMKAYPGQHSTAQKKLFAGTARAVTMTAGNTAATDLKLALDALFNHPNVGPFIGRRLIQNLVSSNPSPAYVARVATVFNDNGKGVRGDLGAVVRAILLDSEARTASATGGKLREPMLRAAHWARAFGATSVTGRYAMSGELTLAGQNALSPPSVFGYFRPGYVPPNTQLSSAGITAPEFQILNEATGADWMNVAQTLTSWGLGWASTGADVYSTYDAQVALGSAGDIDGVIDQVNLLMFNGTMSSALRQDLLDAMSTIAGTTDETHRNRARVAVFLTLASPEYLVQR